MPNSPFQQILPDQRNVPDDGCITAGAVDVMPARFKKATVRVTGSLQPVRALGQRLCGVSGS